MITQPIGIKILKSTGLMIGRGEKFQKGQRRLKKFLPHGGLRMLVGVWHIKESSKQFVTAPWFDSPASDAEKSNPLLITRIMTSLLRLCGFASLAINNVTKN
jgi:hypothetical protein